MNIWLFAILQAVTSVILTFVFIVIFLTLDRASGMNFVWSFIAGSVLSLPIAWLVYRRMTDE